MRFYVPFVAAMGLLAGAGLGPGMGAALAQTAPAAPDDAPSSWIADRTSGCKVWDAVPAPGEKITWSGKCEAGMAEGNGTLQFYIGDRPATRYEGDMRSGRADGHGVNVEPDGARYEGQWRNNAPNGYGVHTRDGKRTEGTWADGCLKQGDTELAVGVSRESCGFK